MNNPNLTDPIGPDSKGDAVLRAAILLDRVNYSSGEIAASYKDNLKRAIAAFQGAHNLVATGTLDSETWQVLNAKQLGLDRASNFARVADPDQPESTGTPALITYTVTLDDVKGPFTKIPKARNGEELMLKEAKLPQLNYSSPLEALAAKFHIGATLLIQLNPRTSFAKSGNQIIVPNVLTAVPGKAASVIVDASDRGVTALDAEGRVLAHYPATIGSEHDPLPIGNWKILGKQFYPRFHYNAKLFWDAENKRAKAILPPGPKSPVGLVWIDLSKEHYGIHGTPNPSTIGKAESHGCIRLTNWDAEELANMVAAGTPVILQE